MIRIDRIKLDAAIDALTLCAEGATNINGQRIIFPLSREAAEAAVCGALSIVAPHGGPVTPGDVHYIDMEHGRQFP